MQSILQSYHRCILLSKSLTQLINLRHHIRGCYGNKMVSQSYRQCHQTKQQQLTVTCHRQHQHCQQRTYTTTSLFKSDALEQTCPLDLDLDLQSQLKDVQKLEKLLAQRGIKLDAKSLVAGYSKLMELKEKKVAMDAEKKQIALQIKEIGIQQKKNKSKDLSEEAQLLKEKGRKMKEKLKPLVREIWDVEETVILSALTVPNHLLSNTPLHTAQVVEEYFSDKKQTTQKSHLELVEETGLVKFSNVGMRAYYLRGELAGLEQNLIEYVTEELRGRSYTQMLCPEIFKAPVVEGYGFNLEDSSEVYRLEQTTDSLQESIADRLFLRGTSQLSPLAYFMRVLVNERDLPLSVFSVGRNYLPVNEDMDGLPGLFGVLQSVKFEGCSLCKDEVQTEKMFKKLREDLIQISKIFCLPMRLVALPASSLILSEQYREEVQMWVPSLHNYVKVGSVSVTGDFCSRRLMIRYSSKDSSKPVHMVHAEMANITRLIALLIEHGRTDIQLTS